MACIDCNPGDFNINDFNWTTVPSVDFELPYNTVLKLVDPSRAVVSKKGVSQPFFAPSGGQIRYYNWGGPQAIFLAILVVEGGTGNSGRRTVTIIDIESAGLTPHQIFDFLAPSSVQLPILNHCAGGGGVILAKAFTGTSTLAGIYTSGTGEQLCYTDFPLTEESIKGKATETELQILRNGESVSKCPNPTPDCIIKELKSGKIDFGEAITGNGVNANLSSITKQITIHNRGKNCLHIDSITDTENFKAVFSASNNLPVVLQPNGDFKFDIRFAPPVVSSEKSYKETLTISPEPTATNKVIPCYGIARPPHRSISYSPVKFGAVPVGSSATQNLLIQNTGEVSVTVSIPAPPSGSYNWVPPTGAEAVIAAKGVLAVKITFTPTSEVEDDRTVTFQSDADGSPHTLQLSGRGCYPRPVIQVPDTSPLDFQNVQLGFRTVRAFTVRNTGKGDLSFSARIKPIIQGDDASESDAAQFGLLEDSATSVIHPLIDFADHVVAPQVFCGPGISGTGEFTFGVAFYATGTNRTVNANLEIFNHNDTASGAPVSFTISLTATVVNPVSIDVELVLDHSRSMLEVSGTRTKMDTARDAAKLFVALSRADTGDRIGLVRFGDEPDIVQVDGNSIQEITSANQQIIGDAINPDNFSPKGNTCIAGGVLMAQKIFSDNPRAIVAPELNKIILVLTDGIDNVPYTNPDDGISYSLLGGPTTYAPSVNTVALPSPTDIKIYAVGIGDNIDIGRLSVLSNSTGGAFLQTHDFSGTDYFNLEKHFTQVYMEAVKYAAITDPVFTINQGETQQFPFDVLEGDKSAMVVIYDKDGIRIPFFIQSPAGETIDLLSIPTGFSIRPGLTPTARFIEINMPQGEPYRYAGVWKVLVKHDRRACRFSDSISEYESYSVKTQHTKGDSFQAGFQPSRCENDYQEPILYGIAIGVGSNFNMVPFVTPGIAHVGDPIQLTAVVSEFGLPVKGSLVTVLATRPDGVQSTHILFDDGRHGDDEANDGTYGLSYIHTMSQGTYTFLFTCTGYNRDGKAVKRESVRSKYVEGNEPLIVSSNSSPATSVRPKDYCCRSILLLLWILVILGVIAIFLLFFLWLKK